MGGPCNVDGEDREELDNFYSCSVKVDGQVWPSSEHYFQACKFPNDEEHRKAICMAPSGWDAYKLGNSKIEELRDDWEEVKVDMMYRANLAKFSQNAHLRNILIRSRGPITAQGNPTGWKTWNEVLLERIREELREYSAQDSNVLRQRMASMEAYRDAAKSKDEYAKQVATVYASKRMPIPRLEQTLVIAGADKELDGLYNVDLLVPEANGQAHYSRQEGGHLYLGVKNGKSAWVLDEAFCPDEATGTAYITSFQGGCLPQGQFTWQCFDEARHVDRVVTIQIQ
jgi:ribA/ribD-fused uncharacterized protein